MAPTASALTFCAASSDGALFVTGVDEELDGQDVKHSLFWHRVGGDWKKYKWNNRVYGVTAYSRAGSWSVAYLGYEGTLKVIEQGAPSRIENLDAGQDAPSSLRSVTCIRQIGDFLYVVGMRRMVYRRQLDQVQWQRYDDGLRLSQRDTAIAGLNSIDGTDADHLVAVGLNGEIWVGVNGSWHREDSPTNVPLATVRHLGKGVYVVGGAGGLILVGQPGNWSVVTHEFMDETFECVEVWADRCFLAGDSGQAVELVAGRTFSVKPLVVEGIPAVEWIYSVGDRVYFLGSTRISSLGADGWRNESPPPALLV